MKSKKKNLTEDTSVIISVENQDGFVEEDSESDVSDFKLVADEEEDASSINLEDSAEISITETDLTQPIVDDVTVGVLNVNDSGAQILEPYNDVQSFAAKAPKETKRVTGKIKEQIGNRLHAVDCDPRELFNKDRPHDSIMNIGSGPTVFAMASKLTRGLSEKHPAIKKRI